SRLRIVEWTLGSILFLAALFAGFHTLNEWFDFGHESQEDLTARYAGFSEDRLVHQLGKPFSIHVYPCSECQDILRRGVGIMVKQRSGGNDQAQVKELTWQYRAYWLTIWLAEDPTGWTVISAIRY